MTAYRWTLRPAYRLAVLIVACSALFVVVDAGSAATPRARLLATYQPVTQFDPQERFLPTSVQSFVADSDLERLVAPGTGEIVNPDPEPGELPGPGTGDWRLNQDSCTPAAALGGLECYAAAWGEGSGGTTVYGRVVRQEDRIVLQYWYFYYDDVYSYRYPPSDFIWQAHEGDWEVVNVVLSEDEEPQFVGYSQHCRGQRRSWATTPLLGTHPVVHVAAGSHANYFSTGAHPIQIACIPPPALAFFQASGLPLPVDRSFDGGDVAGPREAGGIFTHVREIEDDHPSWVAFQGFWGELQYFHAPAPIGTVVFGTSPQGPAYHAVWIDPLGTLAGWPVG